jgi:lactoylglutathione lyase
MKKNTVASLALVAVLLLWSFGFSQSSTAHRAPEFDHAALHVHDLQKSTEFYEKVMGLARIPDPFKDNRHAWFRIGAHEQLHIIGDATDRPTRDIDVHLAFRVASVPDFMNQLDQMKVTYRNSTASGRQIAGMRPDGVRQIYFQDPDGYWIEVNDDRF